MEELQQLIDQLLKDISQVNSTQNALKIATEKLSEDQRNVLDMVDVLPSIFNNAKAALDKAATIPVLSEKILEAAKTQIDGLGEGLANPEEYKKHSIKIQQYCEELKNIFDKASKELG